MIKRKEKLIVFLVVVCILLIAMQSIGFAVETKFKRTLDVWYNAASIVVNGKEMTSDVKPFIVDGTTYVPLRMMANIFNKDIQWDPVLSKATVTDKTNYEIQNLTNQLIVKDIEISRLNNKIKELQAELEEDDKIDINDLEDQLNDDYDEYGDAEFEITLSGDEDDITVKIDIDLDDYQDEWDDLDEDDIEDYLQDIIDDILDAYEDADIEGYIRDSASRSKLVEFDISSNGNVRLTGLLSSTDVDDLESDLDDEYSDYFDDIDLSIELYGDEDEIFFTINLHYDDYEDEWDDLDEDDIEDLMSDIYDDIEYEYEDADIEGYIYDKDNNEDLYHYTRTSSGSPRFTEL